MAEIICPQCKASNRGTAQYCAECGAPLIRLSSKPNLGASASGRAGLVQPSLGVGAVLQNRYRIEQELGRGGFGAVYRGWDGNLNRPCAVKENLGGSPEGQRQFTREATVLANLSHPNLPRVIDHFIVPEQGQYLVMDFVEGEDLASIVKDREIIPVEQALDWILQVADALDYLHSQEPPVLHRDIKPANIRITPKGKAMLVDFGLVKVSDSSVKTTLGARAITPGYAPPEQYGQGKTDARTDIYALGATLYCLITGQEPIESVARMAREHLPTAHALNPNVPPPVSEAIEGAMSLAPASRFQTAAEFRAALQAAQAAARLEQTGKNLATVLVEPALESVTSAAASAVASTGAQTEAVSPAPVDLQPATTLLPQVEVKAPPKKAKTNNKLIFGIAGAAALALLFCLGALAVGYLFDGSGDATATGDATEIAARVQGTRTRQAALLPTNTKAGTATPTAQLKATQTAQVKATRTAQARATSTARLKGTVTAQAKAQATGQAMERFLSDLDAQGKYAYGPKTGGILHNNESQFIQTVDADVNLRNFIVECTFSNPYPTSEGKWDFGLLFRDSSTSNYYKLIFHSDKSWDLFSKKGASDAETITEGKIEDLVTTSGRSNKIRLYAKGDRGWLVVNDRFIREFDLSQQYSGTITLGVGFYKNSSITGKKTEYKSFTIWSLPASP